MAVTATDKFRKDTKKALADRDFAALAKRFNQYGNHLELMGADDPVGRRRFFDFPTAKTKRILRQFRSH